MEPSQDIELTDLSQSIPHDPSTGPLPDPGSSIAPPSSPRTGSGNGLGRQLSSVTSPVAFSESSSPFSPSPSSDPLSPNSRWRGRAMTYNVPPIQWPEAPSSHPEDESSNDRCTDEIFIYENNDDVMIDDENRLPLLPLRQLRSSVTFRDPPRYFNPLPPYEEPQEDQFAEQCDVTNSTLCKNDDESGEGVNGGSEDRGRDDGDREQENTAQSSHTPPLSPHLWNEDVTYLSQSGLYLSQSVLQDEDHIPLPPHDSWISQQEREESDVAYLHPHPHLSIPSSPPNTSQQHSSLDSASQTLPPHLPSRPHRHSHSHHRHRSKTVTSSSSTIHPHSYKDPLNLPLKQTHTSLKPPVFAPKSKPTSILPLDEEGSTVASLSSQEAEIRLTTSLNQLKHILHLKSIQHPVPKYYTLDFMIISAICVIFLIISALLHKHHQSNPGNVIELFIEAVVVALVALLSVLVDQWHGVLAREGVERVVTGVVNDYFNDRAEHYNQDLPTARNAVIVPSSTVSVIAVYRDAVWRLLPDWLVVEGDIIHLKERDVTLADVQSFDHPEAELKAGETVTAALAGEYLVLTPPVMSLVTTVDQVLGMTDTLFNRRLMVLTKIRRILTFLGIVLVFIVNGASYARLQTDASGMFFSNPVYVVISLLPLASSILLFVIPALSNSDIMSILRSLQQHDGDHPSFLEKLKETVLALQGRGAGGRLAYGKCPYHVLGSVTVISCLDKDGILCSQIPTVERLVLLSQRCEGDGDGGIPGPIILDITNEKDHNMNIRFENPNWRSYISSLKPIGLNCMVNNDCGYHTPPLNNLPSDTAFCSTNCLFYLAKEVGFADDAAGIFSLELTYRLTVNDGEACCALTNKSLMNYYGKSSINVKQNQTSNSNSNTSNSNSSNSNATSNPNPKRRQTSTTGDRTVSVSCVVVKDSRNDSRQLLSKGNTRLVLEQCSHYWDGASIKPLTKEDRKSVLDLDHSWSHTRDFTCVAMSYKPVSASPPDTSANAKSGRPPTPSKSKMHPSSSATASNRKEDGENDTSIPSTPLLSKTLEPGALCEIAIEGGGPVDGYRTMLEGEGRGGEGGGGRGGEGGKWGDGVRRHASDGGKDRGTFGLAGRRSTGFVTVHFGRYSRRSTLPPPDIQTIIKLSDGQIFLGMVALRRQPRSDIVDLIDEVLQCGIRFVWFSSEQERIAKAFAERLGMDTDWNSSISLEEPSYEGEEGGGHKKTSGMISTLPVTPTIDSLPLSSTPPLPHYPDSDGSSSVMDLLNDPSSIEIETVIPPPVNSLHTPHDPVPLPRGIPAIRQHLSDEIDNVPLLVPLFTECSPLSTRDMISIMQDNDEIVCVVGSSMHAGNRSLFSQGNISVGIDPSLPKERRIGFTPNFDKIASGGGMSGAFAPRPPSFYGRCYPYEVSFASATNTIACAIRMTADQNLLHLMAAVAESRRLLKNSIQLIDYLTRCQGTVLFILIFATALALPPIMVGGPILYITMFVSPLLALGLMATGPTPEAGEEITRRANRVQEEKQGVNYLLFKRCCRAIPSILVTGIPPVIVYVLSLSQNNSVWPSASQLFQGEYPDTILNNWSSSDIISARVWPQNYALSSLVLNLCSSAVSSISRVHSLSDFAPITNNPILIYLVIAILIGHVVVVWMIAASRGVATAADAAASLPHPAVIVVALLWPIVIVLVEEWVKRAVRARYLYQQKKSWLLFNTKLGMHSPI